MTVGPVVPPEVLQAAAILGVAPSATDVQIKLAFRWVARQEHPDMQPRPDAGAAGDPGLGAGGGVAAGSGRAADGVDLAALGRARDVMLQWRASPESAQFGSAQFGSGPHGSAPPPTGSDWQAAGGHPRHEPGYRRGLGDGLVGAFRLLAGLAIVLVLAIGAIALIGALSRESAPNVLPVEGRGGAEVEQECVWLVDNVRPDAAPEPRDCALPFTLVVLSVTPGDAECRTDLVRYQAQGTTWCLRPFH